MTTTYRKTASEQGERKKKRQRYKGVPQLAAEIADVTVGMVYKVIYGKAQSASVEKAIVKAKKLLGLEEAA